MAPASIVMLALVVLSLAGLATGVFSVWYVRAMLAKFRTAMDARRESPSTAIEKPVPGDSAPHELEDPFARCVEPEPATHGISVMQRAEAIRRYDSGESPEEIASALQLKPHELALLLKVRSSAALGRLTMGAAANE